MKKVDLVCVGDVIIFDEDDCKIVPDASIGQYVVEEVTDRGGWFISARKLDKNGLFFSRNPTVEFHLCPGYNNSLTSVSLVRHMIRIFI